MRVPDRNPKQFFTDKPIFAGQKNGLITCAICGWEHVGLRSNLYLAWNEHYRMNHSQDTGTVYIRDAKPLESIILAR